MGLSPRPACTGPPSPAGVDALSHLRGETDGAQGLRYWETSPQLMGGARQAPVSDGVRKTGMQLACVSMAGQGPPACVAWSILTAPATSSPFTFTKIQAPQTLAQPFSSQAGTCGLK